MRRLSMNPAACRSFAVSCTASRILLAAFRLALAMDYLRQCRRLQEPGELSGRQLQEIRGDGPQPFELALGDVRSIVLLKPVKEEPATRAIRGHDGSRARALATASHGDALLEDAAAEVRVCQASLHLDNRFRQHAVCQA